LLSTFTLFLLKQQFIFAVVLPGLVAYYVLHFIMIICFFAFVQSLLYPFRIIICHLKIPPLKFTFVLTQSCQLQFTTQYNIHNFISTTVSAYFVIQNISQET